MTSDQDPDAADIDVDVVDDDADGLRDETESDGAEAEPTPAAGRRLLHRWVFRPPSRKRTLALSVPLILAVALTAWLYQFQYRPVIATDAHVADIVTSAAREGTVALLSYAPGTLQSDFDRARLHLTGEFLDYYNQFTTEVVTPAATEKKVQTEAKVMRSAVAELRPNSAKVLVFIDQSTSSTAKPDPAVTASSVLVSLEKRADKWLISAFDPV